MVPSLPRWHRFSLPTRTDRASITPLTLWWVAVASLGLIGITQTTESLMSAHCARTTADAVALALVAHGDRVAGEFARAQGATFKIESDEPTVVRVQSVCGVARSAATRGVA